MSIKEQIEESKRKINSLRIDVSRVRSEISRQESRKIQASSGRTMGIAFMANPTMRPFGAYKYISSSSNMSLLTSTISGLKSKKSNLETQLRSEESNLRLLEEKYRNLPEAKLIVNDNSIFIEGDPSQKDILSPVYDKIDSYIAEHKKIRESESVISYNSLKAELESSVEKSNLPEATKKNLEELKILKNRLMDEFGYIVVNGKVLVDCDFISRPIAIAEDKVKNLQTRIDDNQARRDTFEPTFWGKIFKGVREKQKQELEDKISRVDMEYKTYQGEAQADFDYYSEVKAKYVEPSLEHLELLGKLTRLVNSSYDVSKYLQNEEKYNNDINPKTILSEIGIDNVPDYIVKNLQTYLDKNDLQLTRETVLNAILSCPYHKEIAEQIQSKTIKAPAAENNGTEYGM